MMTYLHGPLLDPVPQNFSRIFSFNQSPNVTGINDIGFAYIPTYCESSNCKVHFMLHGCDMNYKSVDLEFVKSTQMNEVAEANKFVIIYP